MLNRDFIRDLFANKKKLLTLSEVKPVSIPRFDECSVKSVWPIVQKDPELMLYFPTRMPNGKNPERQYLFAVLNTLRPDYVRNLVAYANHQRYTAD